jgi:hypothetical protein
MSEDVKLSIGIDAGAVNPEMAKMTSQLAASFAKIGKGASEGTKPANEAMKGLEESLKAFRREEKGESRLVGFYAKELGAFAGIAEDATTALGGMAQGMLGLVGATNPLMALWAAFELGSAAVGYVTDHLKEVDENAKKASESISKIADRLVDLQRKRQGVTEADVEAGRVDAARRLLAERDAARSAFEDSGGGTILGGGDSSRLDAINAAIYAWEKVNGKLETYVSLQSKVTEELKLQETEKQVATGMELSAEARLLSAKNARQTLEAQYTNDILSIQRKWIDNALTQVQLEQAITNAYLKRSKALEELQIAQFKLMPAAEPYSGFEDSARLNPDAALQQLADQETLARESKRIAEETRQDEMSGAFSGYETPGGQGEGFNAAKKSAEDAKMLQDAWGQVGSSIGGVFSQIGASVGGMAGSFISAVGQMISQAIALIVALTMSDSLMMGPAGIFAAIPAAAGILAAVISMIGSVPSFDVGTDYVPRTGLAMIHKGERIVTAEDNARGGGVNVTFNAPVDQAWWRANERHIVRTVREASRAGRA